MNDATKHILEYVDALPYHPAEPRISMTFPNGVVFSYTEKWEREMERVRSLIEPLEAMIGIRGQVDEFVQDSNHMTDIYLNSELYIRFSAFGDLFTIVAFSPLLDDAENSIVYLVESQGYRYVDEYDLAEPYSGVNAQYHGKTWWSRFFDYM